MTREEVIKGLECCSVYTDCSANGGCPYKTKKYMDCLNTAIKDAIALLKAQDARVMTLEEALAADYVYLEIKLHASLPCDCCILARGPDGDILPLRKGFCAYLDGEEYGKTWRCWTSRPTDEQREAEPWK